MHPYQPPTSRWTRYRRWLLYITLAIPAAASAAELAGHPTAAAWLAAATGLAGVLFLLALANEHGAYREYRGEHIDIEEVN